MKIDVSKANLLEKDIEDWLYENPQSLYAYHTHNPIVKWIGRQYTLPSGIADLVGVREDGLLVVVEVKNVPINKAAVLQVCRYALDLKYIASERMDYAHCRDNGEPIIEMALVGPSIDGQTFYETKAVDVRVFKFEVELSLNMSSLSWTSDYYSNLRDQRSAIAAKPEWTVLGATAAEDYEEYQREQRKTAEDKLLEEIEKHAREYAAEHGDNECSDMVPVNTETDDSGDDPF